MTRRIATILLLLLVSATARADFGHRTAMKPALVSLLLWGAAAATDESLFRQEARALFTEGNQRMKTGDHAGALERYERAYALFPSAKILLNIGTALRQIGRAAEAADAYDRYLADAGRDPSRSAEVHRCLDELDARLAIVQIDRPSPKTRVRLDGKPIEFQPGKSQREQRVQPGEHFVMAEEEGRTPQTRQVMATAGKRTVVVLQWATEPSTPIAVPNSGVPVNAQNVRKSSPVLTQNAETGVASPATAPAGPTLVSVSARIDSPSSPTLQFRPSRLTRFSGLGVATAGLALLGSAAVFGALYAIELDHEDHGMSGYNPRLLSNYETLGLASLGIGAAALIAGAVLVGVGLHQEKASTPRAVVAPIVGSGRMGAVLQLSF